MKVIAIIPCRYGSTRFDGQGKPIAPILGKPMIQWVYEKAKESDMLDEVVVATDDERIRDAVRRFGGRVEMTARVHRSGTDRTAEAARILGLDAEDIVINIQGDQPAFDTRCLSQLVEPLQKDPVVNMTTLVYKITNPAELEDPNHVKCVFDHNGFGLYFSRSLIPFGPVGEITYDVFKHLGLYAYRKRFLDVFAALPQGRLEALERLEMLRALEFGHPIKIVETPYDSLEVDTRKDIAKLEAVLQKTGAGYQ